MLVHVLLVGGREELGRRIHRSLEGAEVLIAEEPLAERLFERLQQESYDLVLADAGTVSTATVPRIRDLPGRPEVVLLDDNEDPVARAELQAAGAFALVSTGLEGERFRQSLRAIVERYREIRLDRMRAEETPSSMLGDFSSRSPAMQQLLALARKVVDADSSLLLLGETGVGKEWLARAIHGEGPRSGAPFVAINCAAVPDTLLESELFGHEKGAFSGATGARRGAFELAHQGTLFLDEIGDLPPHLQVKLLRALQEHEIRRLGSERSVVVDVRIMAATNRDLAAAMEAGELRRDLYYRLGVVTLTVPPLRERREDIEPLVENYVAHFKSQLARTRLEGIAEEAVHALVEYDWPGNVRELINVLERAVLLCDGRVVETADLPEEIADPGLHRLGSSGENDAALLEPDLDLSLEQGRDRLVEAYERAYLERCLASTAGHVGETAKRAGIDVRTLYNKMKAYGLRKESYRRKRDVAARASRTSSDRNP